MRRPVRLIVSGAFVALALACGDGGGDPTAAGTAPTSNVDPAVASFASLVNAHRRSVGCPDLIWHDKVAAAAQAHSDDMAQRDYFSHDTPEGKTPWDRLHDAGVTWSGPAGENIAMGYTSAQSVLDGWLASPGHRANIENCAFTHHGVGVKDGRWTHDFVTDPAP
jgi:uncharacterized protein YkwD